jgi:hypothetical protein
MVELFPSISLSQRTPFERYLNGRQEECLKKSFFLTGMETAGGRVDESQ